MSDPPALLSSHQANIICGIIVPRMLSPTAWNWGPKSGIFWAGSCFLCLLYCIFRLPETRGRSYGELDLMFQNHIPAWRFSKTNVDRECTDSGKAVDPS